MCEGRRQCREQLFAGGPETGIVLRGPAAILGITSRRLVAAGRHLANGDGLMQGNHLFLLNTVGHRLRGAAIREQNTYRAGKDTVSPDVKAAAPGNNRTPPAPAERSRQGPCGAAGERLPACSLFRRLAAELVVLRMLIDVPRHERAAGDHPQPGRAGFVERVAAQRRGDTAPSVGVLDLGIRLMRALSVSGLDCSHGEFGGAELLDRLGVAIGDLALLGEGEGALADLVGASGGVGVASGEVDGHECSQPCGDRQCTAADRVQQLGALLVGDVGNAVDVLQHPARTGPEQPDQAAEQHQPRRHRHGPGPDT